METYISEHSHVVIMNRMNVVVGSFLFFFFGSFFVFKIKNSQASSFEIFSILFFCLHEYYFYFYFYKKKKNFSHAHTKYQYKSVPEKTRNLPQSSSYVKIIGTRQVIVFCSRSYVSMFILLIFKCPFYDLQLS